MTASQHLQPYGYYAAKHFLWKADGRVGTIVLSRPDRKNALTWSAAKPSSGSTGKFARCASMKAPPKCRS